jgi:glycosyl transferase family 9 (putative heptosyltransferase)
VSRVYVAPISFGLGDLVVSLPAIQALISRGRHDGVETWLVARSVAQARLADRIAGLTGWVDEESFDRDDHDGRFVDLRDHPLQRDWWWGSAEFENEFGTLRINDILGRICADFGIPADFTRPIPLAAFPRPELSSSVILVTESDGASKQWSLDRWRSLADGLRALGLDMRLVTRDEPAPEMRALGIAEARAPSPGDALDVLGAARAVIGIDTGLTHLAVQQGTPTVTICRAPAVFFRPWPHAGVVVGDLCDDACIAAEKEYAYNARVDLRGFRWQPRMCPVGGRCLDSVRPEDVLAALENALRSGSRAASRR